MNNNDILIKLRYALDIKNTEMVEIFKLGGIEFSEEEVQEMLLEPEENNFECKNSALESFLNGFIIFKRGERDSKPGQSEIPSLSINSNRSINNIMLKKLKIALSLSSQDMLDIFKESGDALTKDELSNLFRKEGHKHYKKCNDKHAMSFLEELAKRNIKRDN